MIKSLNKKKGGLRRTEADMEAFGDWIAEQRLVDIQTTNGIYTWNNRRGGRHQIASRVDQFLMSEQIINWDIFIEAAILSRMGSDHWPIKAELDIKSSPKRKPFRFEAFWLRDKNFMKKVEEWKKQNADISDETKRIERITREQNLALMRAATLEEVEEIVKGMKKNKAPSPDGFMAELYQAGWDFLGQDILDVVEESRRNQKVSTSLNSTLLSLIPKETKSEVP
eukprot:PITA_22615